MVDGLLQAVVEQGAVGQSGERIVRGLLAQRRARVFQFEQLRLNLPGPQPGLVQGPPGDQQCEQDRADAQRRLNAG